jgi:hypothetical protein
VKAVLYDVDWQRLRISFLQARSDIGGWTEPVGMRDNLERLYQYLEHAETTLEMALRKYRINNCLNAVVMGYNGQGASDDLISEVRNFRLKYAQGFRTFDVRRASLSWNWDAQLRALIEFYQCEPTREEFDFLRKDLTHRSKNGSRENRPELYKFLELMATAART